jgi:hypothetical protein
MARRKGKHNFANERHDRGLTELLKNIRHEIPGTQVIIKEAQFWEGNHLVAEPDGLIWDGETLHIIEYKYRDCAEEKAHKQLATARRFIENDIGLYVPCNTIFMYG